VHITLYHSHSERQGVVYFAVLGISLMLSVICLTSLQLARLEHRESRIVQELSSARLAAQSGIDFALSRINSDPDWRTNYNSGQVVRNDSTWGNLAHTGTFEFMLIDEDGDLADEPHHPVTVRATGRSGDAVFVKEVVLQPAGEGISCLSASFHGQGDLEVHQRITTNQTISSNSNIYANFSNGRISGDAQAVGEIPGTVDGTKTEGMSPPLQMPDEQSVYEYYLSNGTHIGYGQITNGTIESVVISPGNNPYGLGTTNVQGIYVIDCQGNDLVIRNSRINATLVFSNAGTVRIRDYIHWEPAIANFPAMMVQGDLRLDWRGGIELSENLIGVNFNPPGSPYNGTTDNNLTTVYPGTIWGLIYVQGNLRVTDEASLYGVTVVAGESRFDQPSNLTFDPLFVQNAPPGFSGGSTMRLVPGSWKHVTSP